jgi:GNAT superfamily N-acetyltransferase
MPEEPPMRQTTPHAPDQPDSPRWTATLSDRRDVLIRPLHPRDREAEREFIAGLSPEARSFRFLGQVATPGEALLDALTNVDFARDAAFAAMAVEDGREHIVGVARFCLDRDGTRCECAVTVADEWRDRGLGTTLMRHLIDVARARGIRTMYSIDSAENGPMRDLAHHLGFERRIDPDDASQVIHTLAL